MLEGKKIVALLPAYKDAKTPPKTHDKIMDHPIEPRPDLARCFSN